MGITPSGRSGQNVVQPVAEDSKYEQEDAPIPLHNTEEETVRVWVQLMKPSHAA